MTVQISYDHAVKLQYCIKIGKSEKIILFGTLWAIDLYMLSTALCTPKSDACGIPGVSGSRPESRGTKVESVGLFIILLPYDQHFEHLRSINKYYYWSLTFRSA